MQNAPCEALAALKETHWNGVLFKPDALTPAAKAHNNRRFPALSDVTLETLSR